MDHPNEVGEEVDLEVHHEENQEVVTEVGREVDPEVLQEVNQEAEAEELLLIMETEKIGNDFCLTVMAMALL